MTYMLSHEKMIHYFVDLFHFLGDITNNKKGVIVLFLVHD
ncbi:MAG: hypothetical protein JWP06_1044 [Candidatus Saccharibacteria bacterium]|nr:hypothetical protein [Candidatus Saccharibacteria bacterium]